MEFFWILVGCVFISAFVLIGCAMASQLDEETKEFTCPNCGKVNRYAVFCRDCGTRIRPDVRCPKCGLMGTGQYCGTCGTELKR